jgi:hypothetical protein
MTESDLDRLAAAIAPTLRRYEQQQQTREQPSRHGDERRDVNVERSGLWMDYKTLVGVLMALGVSAWWGSGQFSQIQYEMRELRSIMTGIPKQFETTVSIVKEALTQRIERIEMDRAIKMMDRYSRADHEVWCLETEKLNRKNGWECAPLDPSHVGARGLDLNQDRKPFTYYQTDQKWKTKVEPEK